jgi:hypothetical protein
MGDPRFSRPSAIGGMVWVQRFHAGARGVSGETFECNLSRDVVGILRFALNDTSSFWGIVRFSRGWQLEMRILRFAQNDNVPGLGVFVPADPRFPDPTHALKSAHEWGTRRAHLGVLSLVR